MYIETSFASGTGTFGEAAPDFAASDNALLNRFNESFETVTATTREQIRDAQRIRYQVYCIEKSLEAPNGDAIESDGFDAHAVHGLLFSKAAGKALGTVRLVLPVHTDIQNSFPTQSALRGAALRKFNGLPLHAAAEVSRFSISRQMRRTNLSASNESGESGPLMRLGLIQALVRMSVEFGVEYWCAIMEPTLLRMLAAMAIRFEPIGPLVEFHGLRQPCYCHLPDVLEAVRRERPTFWSVLTEGGTLLERAACG